MIFINDIIDTHIEKALTPIPKSVVTGIRNKPAVEIMPYT